MTFLIENGKKYIYCIISNTYVPRVLKTYDKYVIFLLNLFIIFNKTSFQNKKMWKKFKMTFLKIQIQMEIELVGELLHSSRT